jgi:tRNA(Ile)-lysidine synthase
MDLLDHVRRTLRRYDLAGPGTRVIAAVSGGSDSVALAHVLHVLDGMGECRLIGLAHFNHQLRGTAADRDEAFCAGLAKSFGRPLVVDRADVQALARLERRSLEDAGRTARHAFLERARRELGADVVALGHTRDDQAETFLLRLLRGAGSRGLGSMHPRRGTIVRPLIDCRRSALKEYLSEHAIPFVHDETNDDVGIPRNRVRAELLPLVEARFNPSLVDVLADEAELARDEHDYLASAAEEVWPQIVRLVDQRWFLDILALSALPAALRRLLVRRAMSEAAAGRAVRFADVERTLALARDNGLPFDAPGQRVERIGSDVVLTGRPQGAAGRPAATKGRTNFFHYSLSIPGEVVVAEADCVLSAEVANTFEPDAVSGRDGVAVVQLDKSTEAFAVRNRRPGDRFRPFGLGQRKKLQDFFVDRKVVREHRDRVPIVVDSSDRIVWVAGHSINEDFRVTDPAQAVIILRLKAVGGPV